MLIALLMLAGSIANAETLSPEDAARATAEFKEIQALFSKGLYDLTISKAAEFESSFPSHPQTPQVRNMHGLGYLLTQKPSAAVTHFRKALEGDLASNARPFIQYNLAAAQFEAALFEEAAATAKEIRPDTLDKDTQVKLHALRSRLYTREGLHVDSVREVLTLGRKVEDLKARGGFLPILDGALAKLNDASQLESLASEFEDSPFNDAILIKLANQASDRKDDEAASRYARALMTRHPQSRYFAQASSMVRVTDDIAKPAIANTIGVLLPLKGKFARFGQKSLQGIQLAFRVFNAGEADSGVTLVAEDSGDDADSAVRALDLLVNRHRVTAVIGPLLSKGIEKVTQRAQELGVPLITLAQSPGAISDRVFLAGITPRLQAREIARHAIQKQGLKRFAVLSPRDKAGELSANAFWDAVEEFGGSIVGFESYNPGETDFRQAVDKLSGLYYTEARAAELEELAKQREAQNIKKRTRKTEQFYSLRPIVDYEAVFIPDEPKIVGQILPTFAYRDVEGVRFLGVSTWHSNELLTRAQNHAEGALFADAFFAESTTPVTKKFVDKFKATFDQEPGVMEALAYDASLVLEAALKAAGDDSADRSEISAKLRETKNFPGVTGKITFLEGALSRDLTVLTVKGGKIIEAKN